MERRHAQATTGIGAATVRSDPELLGAEITALSELEDDALRRRWRRLIGRPLPKELGRGLTLRILAYYQQVQQFGDLDRASQQVLAESASVLRGRPDTATPRGSDSRTASERADKSAKAGIIIRPGTLLVREHEGVSHRVMALEDGFVWNGKTYESLSKVAFAITGTRWNGPRFFGLRDKPKGESKRGSKRPGALTSDERSSADPVPLDRKPPISAKLSGRAFP
jgi:hypothetical protein